MGRAGRSRPPPTPKVKPPASDDRPHGRWVIYPFWLLLFLRGDFLLSSGGVALGLLVLAYVDFLFPSQTLIIVGLMAALMVWYMLKWAGLFLIRMIVDYEAANGDGQVIIQRLLPHPTLPEVVQFPLQQAAEGSPEVNTRGIFNTLVQQIKWLKFLRPLTVGDLTLRGPAAPFGITMHGIQDPGGVKAKIAADWKKIAAIKNKKKAEQERREDIERMTIAVTQGLLAASRVGLVELKTPGPGVEFKDETPLAKAEKEVKQQLVPPPPAPVPPEPLKDTGVSDLRGLGADGKPLAERPNGGAEEGGPVVVHEEPEGEDAPGNLPRRPPPAR